MEMLEENRRQFEVLEKIYEDPYVTQAYLAKNIGVAVGTVNWQIKQLVNMGMVTIQRCGRRKLKYILTPQGEVLRKELTEDYINSSFELYRYIRKQINKVLDNLTDYGQKIIVITKKNEIAEVCRLTCIERGVSVVESSDAKDIPELLFDGVNVYIDDGNDTKEGND